MRDLTVNYYFNSIGIPMYDGVRFYEDGLVSKFGKLFFDAEKSFREIGIITNAIHSENGPGKFIQYLQQKN